MAAAESNGVENQADPFQSYKVYSCSSRIRPAAGAAGLAGLTGLTGFVWNGALVFRKAPRIKSLSEFALPIIY